MQGVIEQEGVVSQHMVLWIKRISAGSTVMVWGQIKDPVTGTTKHDAEFSIRELPVVSSRAQVVHFTIRDDEISKDKELDDEAGTGGHVTDHARLTHHILDLRTST